MSTLDLVLANAVVIDGRRGSSPTATDVGVSNGLISDIGDLSGRPRRKTTDVEGHVLAPGFIDTHTHVEIAAIKGHPDRFASLAQGVTTTFTSADGFGWVGLPDMTKRRWWEDTAAIYGQPLDPLPGWANPGDFLAQLRASSVTSVVPMVPHNNVRAAVMGESPAKPDASQMARMHEMVQDWLDAGAVGLATGLDYLPGRYSDTDELVEFVERIVEGGGVYASHIRLLDSGRADAWAEAAEIGHRTGAGVRIAHERLDEDGMALLDQVSGNANITIDSYLYPAGCTSLAFHVPPDLLANGVTALSEKLTADDMLADGLAAHLEKRLTGGLDKKVIVAGTTTGSHEGRTLGSLADERGTSVGRVAVELLKDEMPCAVLIYAWQAPDVSWDVIMKRTLGDDRTLIASDGVYVGSKAHPRGFGTFPRVLGALSRDKGLISLPAAVHKMTGKPAEAYGLSDRGIVEPGRRADLVVFNPETVTGTEDYDNPRAAPQGIELVLVGGRGQREEQQ